MARSFKDLPSQIPVPPAGSMERFAFPGDLLAQDRQFYCQIEMVKYEMRSNTDTPYLSPLGGVLLPLPKAINDVMVVDWGQTEIVNVEGVASGVLSAAGAGLGAALGGGALGAAGGSHVLGNLGGKVGQAAGPLGAYIGATINPMLTMMFKSPTFKEHTLSWTFAPANAQESQALADIINYFRYSALPDTDSAFGGLVLNYPDLAIIKFHPKDQFLWKFKPCAILGISVDYSAAGGPAFHKDGSPTAVNVTLQLKEIEYWTKNTFTV